MDLQALARRLDRGLPPPGHTSLPPTPQSVAVVEAHFRIRLPSALIELATCAQHYGAYFVGLGEDRTAATHIIRINSHWRRRRRTRRLPADLVAITLGYDDDLDCLVRPGGDEAEIVYWSPGAERVVRGVGFLAYLERLISDLERPR